MQVKWTRKALMNLDSAVEYIARDNPVAAQNTARKIWEASSLLSDHPGIGRPGRVAGTRELVVEGLPFIMPYVEEAGTIYILRVMHTSMIWPDGF